MTNEHYTGAENEYKAASWYLAKGYNVFWPAVQQSSADFIVEHPDRTLHRVQVKTATWSKAGAHSYLQCRTRIQNTQTKPSELYDILFVIGGGAMWAIPASEISSSNLSLNGTRAGYQGKWDRYRVQC